MKFYKARRTGLVCRQPFGLFIRKGSRVLCSDGKIRPLARLAETADTIFSVPAAVRIKGRYIHGYVASLEASPEASQYKVARTAVVFHPHTGQEGKHNLPRWPDHWSDEAFNLLAVACDAEPNT